MVTYTRAILLLINDNPGIAQSEIDQVLKLNGRDVERLIRPYLESGHVLMKRTVVEGERKLRTTFSAAGTACEASTVACRQVYQKWTVEDLKILTSLYPHQSNLAIANRLGRTLKQVDAKASKLKLLKSELYKASIAQTANFAERSIYWSAQDIRILRNLYPDRTANDLAELLGKSESQVLEKARKLKLKKSDAFWKLCGERLMASGLGTRLKAQPIGTERIYGGYIFVKVRDPGVWKLKQQQVWGAHRGEYNTRTHSIWFIDRNPLNCDIANLELITRAEVANRTSTLKYPKELRDVITLHNKLKRKLREQHREIA